LTAIILPRFVSAALAGAASFSQKGAGVVEVEMKFPVADFAAIERWLASQGAEPDPPRREEDHYFNAPDRDFAVTDEALRLRRSDETNVLTYKGRKLDTTTKTRTEIEVSIADGDDAAAACVRLLESLRYRPVAVVRKDRRVYRLDRDGFPMEVSLDCVEDVGTFAELEILAEENKVDAAREVLRLAADAMKLGASERRSYLELLLVKKASGQ
jgi:adenylate cyclase, class 2